MITVPTPKLDNCKRQQRCDVVEPLHCSISTRKIPEETKRDIVTAMMFPLCAKEGKEN